MAARLFTAARALLVAIDYEATFAGLDGWEQTCAEAAFEDLALEAGRPPEWVAQQRAHMEESISNFEVYMMVPNGVPDARNSLAWLNRNLPGLMRLDRHRYRLLQRYAREARARREKAYRAWIDCLKRHGKTRDRRQVPNPAFLPFSP